MKKPDVLQFYNPFNQLKLAEDKKKKEKANREKNKNVFFEKNRMSWIIKNKRLDKNEKK